MSVVISDDFGASALAVQRVYTVKMHCNGLPTRIFVWWALAVLALGQRKRWPRTGIGAITLIDMDDVCVTNTNRQIHALRDNVGTGESGSDGGSHPADQSGVCGDGR